jgi:hypothetical protein
MRALYGAYRIALTQPAVRSASEAEIRRQLSTVSPIAVVKGYWVTPIDMSRVYALPNVRTALRAKIATIPGGFHAGLAFTPNELADSFRIPRADVLSMVGVDVLLGRAMGSLLSPKPPQGFVNVFAVVGYIQDAWYWLMEKWQNWQHQREENQRKRKCNDKGPEGDCDNDGTKNKEDSCPYDPDPGCTGNGGSFVECVVVACRTQIFATRFGGEIGTMIQQIVTDIRHSSQTGQVLPLGPAGDGRATIGVAFPPGTR